VREAIIALCEFVVIATLLGAVFLCALAFRLAVTSSLPF
jgi:hypothetical protein